MSFFSKILAFFMAVITFIFPWINKEEQKNPNTYIIEDKCLVVCLPSNPSTGYTWTYDIYGKGIKLDSSEFVSDINDEEICGASGITEFRFVPDGEGEFEIVLQYLRTWEDTLPESRVVLSGCVDKNGNITVEKFEY